MSGGVCFIFQMIMLDNACRTFCHSQIKSDAINIFIMLSVTKPCPTLVHMRIEKLPQAAMIYSQHNGARFLM